MKTLLAAILFLSSQLGFSYPPNVQPPDQNLTLKELKSQIYTQLTEYIEASFYDSDRVTYNEVHERVIRRGINSILSEFRYLREELAELGRNKPNLYGREAINIYLGVMDEKTMSLESLESEIKRWEHYVESKGEQVESATKSDSKQLVEWLTEERAWGSRMLFKLERVKDMYVELHTRLVIGTYFVTEVRIRTAGKMRWQYLNTSCDATINLPF